MSVATALEAEVRSLKARQREVGSMAETTLANARANGREQLNAREKAMFAELRSINDRVKRAEGELRRAGNPAAQIGIGTTPGAGGKPLSTAGRLAPLHFDDEQMRRAQQAALRGETARLETRDPGYSTADPLLPPELFPYPIQAIHESRLLDRLPGYGIEAPSITFIRHVSTTGAPGTVAEGATKPEVVMNTDSLTATAVKLAAHNGLSWEIINDWPAFQSYAGTELYKQIIDLENKLLLAGNLPGSPTEPTGMTGFLDTTGILTYDASGDTGGSGAAALTPLDSVEKAIAKLRVGPALAVPDLLVLHPTTWSALRRIKDGFGHFMVQPDPTMGEANQLWGVDVLQTTQMVIGDGLLIDTTKFGYVAIREPLSMRIGYSGTDLVQNILRTVAEERLVLCVTRPPAVLSIANLPTS